MNEISIHGQLVRELCAGLSKEYPDWREVLQECGIREQDLADPDRRFPIDKVVQLHRLTLKLLDDESLGQITRPLPRGFLRQIMLGVVHARTLDRALTRMVEMLNIFGSVFQYSLEDKGNQVTLNLAHADERNKVSEFTVYYLLSILHRSLGWLANQRVAPKEITVDFSPPPYHTEAYYVFYGAPVHYDCEQISMVFHARDLKLQIVQTEASVERYINRYPIDLFVPVEIGGRLSREVRELVVECLERNHEMPRIDEIAKRMNRHPQALRRALKSERTSYKRLTMQVRRDTAMYHLGHDDISIERVAERAGYSDTSSFIRVFKDWTGFTPLAFRKGF